MGMHIKEDGSPAYTEDFATYISNVKFEDLSPLTIHAGKRGILDWLGCALIGSLDSTPDILIETLKEDGAEHKAIILGKKSSLSYINAAMVNGQMGHLLDFDDTHMGGVVLHASSPTLAALFSESQRQVSSGQNFLLAYICGFEAGVRVGQSAPAHHAGGWHLTGTLGHFSAAVAVAKLLGLNANQMTHTMGIAGTQASGMQQNRGTMCKSFHAGKAAANGILSARLAMRGFNSSVEIVEGKRGFCRIYSATSAPERMTNHLGVDWEVTRNGFKPYACGVVLHPAIDALIALRQLKEWDHDTIESIEVKVNPLVVSITGTLNPSSGLHSKFSIYHSIAVAFLDGKAGIEQYSDHRVLDPVVEKLRQKITVTVDESLQRDQAYARINTSAGSEEIYIEHAKGTVDHPMSDEDLIEKFLSNATPVIGAKNAQQAQKMIWNIDHEQDMNQLLLFCR
jgi:2-methylcitrate dehydratase PrpD